MYRVLIIASCVVIACALYEGDSCDNDGRIGVCLNIQLCKSAQEDIMIRKKYPLTCTYSGSIPIICCVKNLPATPIPVATTPTIRTTKVTTDPPVYDYDEPNTCSPISKSMTSEKIGRKAWDKCIEYQEELVYPCEKSVALVGGLARANHCHHNADQLILGGVDAQRGEFPHMVLLGYGEDPDVAQWTCGGTLISDWFILTAAHCTSITRQLPVSYALVGILRRNERIDSNKLYKIDTVIKHPEYVSPNKYNDIALLKTKRRIKLNHLAVPACLHVGNMVQMERAIVTGWGFNTSRGNKVTNTLQKVTLTKFPQNECWEKFPAFRNLEYGYDSRTQICYGDKTLSVDTCRGDSGGPLQIKNANVRCMYTVIGITSYGGSSCGLIGEPGIYTRVSPYVSWIESIVWP